MNNKYTALIKETENWFIGWIEEIPGVNCQEKTYEKLISSLKETLKESLEFNKIESLTQAGTDYIEEKIAV